MTSGRNASTRVLSRETVGSVGPCVSATKTVGEEGLEGNVFLPDQAVRRQLPVREHIEDGAGGRGGGELDRAQHLAADAPVVDLVGIGLLPEPALPGPVHGDEDHYHVL